MNNDDENGKRDSEGNAHRSIYEAESFIRRRLHAIKRFDEDQDSDVEWELLREWARQVGLILPLDTPAPAPVNGGIVHGREHEILYVPGETRLYKYTYPNLAGFTVDLDSKGLPYMLNASPLEYLRRLRWSNRLFEDDVKIVGLWNSSGNNWRIIISQRLALSNDPLNPHPSEAEVEEWMERLSFKKLPWRGIGYEGCLGYYKGKFEIWDVHRKNFIKVDQRDSGGPVVILPVDLIVTNLDIQKMYSLA